MSVFNANEVAASVTEPIELEIDGRVYTVIKLNEKVLKRVAKDEEAIIAADDADEPGLLQRSIARLIAVDPALFVETEVYVLRAAFLFIMGETDRQISCISDAVKKRLTESDSSQPVSPDSSDTAS